MNGVRFLSKITLAAGILLAAAIFLSCAEVPEDLRNDAESSSSREDASSSGTGLQSLSSGGGGAASSSSSGNLEAEFSSSSYGNLSSGSSIPQLLCSAIPSIGAEGEAIIKPVVTCDGVAVSASSWAGSPHAPDWDSPKEGNYSNIMAIADCGDTRKTADCGGLLTVIPAKLACDAVPSMGVEGMPVTKPAVRCDGVEVFAESWQFSPVWDNPKEGIYDNIKATATCGGISKTAACEGRLSVIPPGGVLTCDAVPSTGAAGVAIALPKVTCDGVPFANASVAWLGAPDWDNPSAGSYSGVKATANCSGASKTADCFGSLTVAPAVLACDAVPSAGVEGMSIAPPAVKCDGVDVYDVAWAGAPDWGYPSAGSYGVKATAACGGASKTAVCSGTLTVSQNKLTCSWAGKPASIYQGSWLESENQRPAVSCSSGFPTNADYTPSVYAAFYEIGSIPVSVTASCGGASQTAQCGTLTVAENKLACSWANKPDSIIRGTMLAEEQRPSASCSDGATIYNLSYTPYFPSFFTTVGNIAVSATASCGGISQTAQCGTLTVVENKLACSWANKPASIIQGQSLDSDQMPTLSCSDGEPSRAVTYTPSTTVFYTTGSIPVSATASCGGVSQTAQCGTLTVVENKLACSWANKPASIIQGQSLDSDQMPTVSCGYGESRAVTYTPSTTFYTTGSIPISVTASCNYGDQQTAQCGTLNVAENELTCSWANKPDSIRRGQSLDSDQMPTPSCSNGYSPQKVAYTLPYYYYFNTAGNIAVSVTASCLGPAPDSPLQTAQCGSLTVVAPPGYSGSYGSLTYQGQTYKTVQIGTQTWMAENLNYNVSGSKCYNNLVSNCNTYGRLYDWATAMALPSSCNSNSSTCASQVSAKHRGICPSGWHIPSDDEWNTLLRYVENTYTNGREDEYLKATNGWDDGNFGIIGNGTDPYGFAALPGGFSSGGGFDDVGRYGAWWSADRYDEYVFDYPVVSIYYMVSGYSGTNSYINYKTNLFSSVRCLQD